LAVDSDSASVLKEFAVLAFCAEMIRLPSQMLAVTV
jgi:hypothetical protein